MVLRLPTTALLLILLLCGLDVKAQEASLSGRTVDADNSEALVRTTLQLYRLTSGRNSRTDTTFVKGVFSDERGRFTFSNLAAGNYLLRASYLGYHKLDKQVTVARNRSHAMGDISLQPNTLQLDEAVITANLPKMII